MGDIYNGILKALGLLIILQAEFGLLYIFHKIWTDKEDY